MLKSSSVRMHNGCAECGGANLTASATTVGVELACNECGHSEVLGNSRAQHLQGGTHTRRRKKSLSSQVRGEFTRANNMRRWG